MEKTPAAGFWQGAPASTVWDNPAIGSIGRDDLDLPDAAPVLAPIAIAIADAEVAAWDGTYAYWTARPVAVDSDLAVLFPIPTFPGYPSARATVSNAAAAVLTNLFPNDELDPLALAAESADSRARAGIHFPIDNDAGQLLGRYVGYLVTDGACEGGGEQALPDRRPGNKGAGPGWVRCSWPLHLRAPYPSRPPHRRRPGPSHTVSGPR